MSDCIDDIIKIASSPEKITSDTAQRIVLEIVKDSHAKTKETLERVEHIDDRLRITEVFLAENPSLLWLLRHRTKETIATLATVFSILALLEQTFSGFWEAILVFIG